MYVLRLLLLVFLSGCTITEQAQSWFRSPEETTRQYLEATKINDQTELGLLSRPLEVGNCQNTVTVDFNKAFTDLLNQGLPLDTFTILETQTKADLAVVKVQMVRGSGFVTLKNTNAVLLEHSTGQWLVAGIVPANQESVEILGELTTHLANYQPTS
ncbi:hypothetical protein [Candidatus Cyanaurora vandensis]|uniref:hypothetical protein n=1 Tax=Candidatus Cyanaurora vandensis TaxID=2714958 RepID=UPI00257A36FD|nr:hypothetical protein [Candidatus Cyanaurora vandensis]